MYCWCHRKNPLTIVRLMDFYYTINSYDKNTTVILSKQYVMHTRIVIKFFSTLNIRKLYRIKYITFYFYTQIFR